MKMKSTSQSSSSSSLTSSTPPKHTSPNTPTSSTLTSNSSPYAFRSQLPKPTPISLPYQTRAAQASSYTPPVQSKSQVSLLSRSPYPPSSPSPPHSTPRGSPAIRGSNTTSSGSTSGLTARSRTALDSGLNRTPLVSARKGRTQFARKK